MDQIAQSPGHTDQVVTAVGRVGVGLVAHRQGVLRPVDHGQIAQVQHHRGASLIALHHPHLAQARHWLRHTLGSGRDHRAASALGDADDAARGAGAVVGIGMDQASQVAGQAGTGFEETSLGAEGFPSHGDAVGGAPLHGKTSEVDLLHPLSHGRRMGDFRQHGCGQISASTGDAQRDRVGRGAGVGGHGGAVGGRASVGIDLGGQRRRHIRHRRRCASGCEIDRVGPAAKLQGHRAATGQVQRTEVQHTGRIAVDHRQCLDTHRRHAGARKFQHTAAGRVGDAGHRERCRHVVGQIGCDRVTHRGRHRCGGAHRQHHVAYAGQGQSSKVDRHRLRQGGAAQAGGGRGGLEADFAGGGASDFQQHVIAHLGGVAVAVEHHRELAPRAQGAFVEGQVGDLGAASASGLQRLGAGVLHRVGHGRGGGLAQRQLTDGEWGVGLQSGQGELADTSVHRDTHLAVGLDQRLELAQQGCPVGVGGQASCDAWLHGVGDRRVGAVREAEAVFEPQANFAWEAHRADLGHAGAGDRGHRLDAGLVARSGGIGARLGHGRGAGVQACAASNEFDLEFVGNTADRRVGQHQRRGRGVAEHKHLVGKQIGRGLLVGAHIPFADRALGVDSDAAAGLEHTHGVAGLDIVDIQVASGLEHDIVAVGHVAHIAHIQVVAGHHLDATVVGQQAFDGQASGLVDQYITADGGVEREGLHQRIELGRTTGVDPQVLGDEHRSTVRCDGSGLQFEPAAGLLGRNDATAHGERAFDAQGHVVGGLEATEPTHKTGQRPVAHGSARLFQLDVDVAQCADLEVQRRQVVGLDVDETGGRRDSGLADGVAGVAIAVEVDAGCGLTHGVVGVAVASEVKGLEHILAALGLEHHPVDHAVFVGRAVVARGLDRDGAGEHQVFTRHQFKQAVGAQCAVKRQGTASLQDDGVGRDVVGQIAGVGVGLGALAKLDKAASAVFDALGRGKVAVELHRIGRHKGHTAHIRQRVAAGWAQHRHAARLAAQGNGITLDQAAVAVDRLPPHGRGGTAHPQLVLHAQAHIILASGRGGDDRAHNVQTRGLFQITVALGQGDVALGGLHIQDVERGLQPHDAGGGADGQHIGHHIHSVIDKGLDHTPGLRGQRNIAGRVQRGVGHHITQAVLDHRRAGGIGRVHTSRDVAHINIAHRVDGDVVAVFVGQRAHIDQIDRSGSFQRQGAVGDLHIGEAERAVALADVHIAAAAGLQAQAVDQGVDRCRGAAQAAVDGQRQLVGLNRFGRISEGEHTLHQEAHITATHPRAAAGDKLAHMQVGAGAGAAFFGAHADVVAVAQTQGTQLHRVDITHVNDRDAAILGLGLGHGQRALVVQDDVAHVDQQQIDLAGHRVEGDATGRAGLHQGGVQAAAGQLLGGEHTRIGVGVAALHQGLHHTAALGFEPDGLARGSGGEGGVGERDVAADSAGAQGDALAAGHHLGVLVRTDVAAAGRPLARGQDNRTCADAAGQSQVAPSRGAEGGVGIGLAHATQPDVAVGAERHRSGHSRLSVLLGQQLARVGHVQQLAGPELQRLGLQAGGDRHLHPVDRGGGHTLHPQSGIGAHLQLLGRLDLAAQAHRAGGIDGDVLRPEGGVGTTESAGAAGVGGDHRLEHGFGHGDGAGLPHSDVFVRDHRHLFGGGLLHRQLLEQVAVQRHQRKALLDPLVVDRLPLRGPGVGVVQVVFLDVAFELLAALHVVDVVLAATLLAAVVHIAHRTAQLIVVAAGRVLVEAGSLGQRKAPAIDDLLVRIAVAVIGATVNWRAVGVPAGGLDIGKGRTVACPAPAPSHRPLPAWPTPLAQLLPVGPVLVLEGKLAIVGAARELAQGRGVKGQCVDVGVVGLDAVGETAELVTLHGRTNVGIQRDGAGVVHIVAARIAAVVVGVVCDLVGAAKGVGPLRHTGDHIVGCARINVVGLHTVAAVTHSPGGTTVLQGRMWPSATGIAVDWEVVARGDLLVVDLAELLVAAHQLTGGTAAHGGPAAARRLEHVAIVKSGSGLQRGVQVRPQRVVLVLLQEQGLPHRDHPQDVHVRALGHAHIAVSPAVDVDVVHHLLVAVPFGGDGLIGLHSAVFGALDHGIAVVELEQRHVTGVLEHRQSLVIVQAGEVLVGGLVGVVGAGRGGTRAGPVHRRVEVVHPFEQHLDKALGRCGVGVVVAKLGQHHVHGGVFRANLEFFVLHHLGDLGGLPGHHRHLDRVGQGHLLVANDGFDGFGHCLVTLDRDRTAARDGGIGVKGDVATGLDDDVATGR